MSPKSVIPFNSEQYLMSYFSQLCTCLLTWNFFSFSAKGKNERSYTFILPHAFMVCTGTTSPLPLPYNAYQDCHSTFQLSSCLDPGPIDLPTVFSTATLNFPPSILVLDI